MMIVGNAQNAEKKILETATVVQAVVTQNKLLTVPSPAYNFFLQT